MRLVFLECGKMRRMSDLPTAPVQLNVLELGYIRGVFSLAEQSRSMTGDRIADALFAKMCAAAELLGVQNPAAYWGRPTRPTPDPGL